MVVVTSTTLSLFPEATTHCAKLTFGVSTWFVHFLHTRLFRKDYDTNCALTFNCAALVALFHRLGRWVVTMLYPFRKGHKRVWKLILYAAPSLLSAESSAGMALISPRRFSWPMSHLWVREAGVSQQVVLQPVVCSRSSVVPGCGVFKT